MLKKILIYIITIKIILIMVIFSSQALLQINNYLFFHKDEKKLDFYKENETLIPIYPYINIKNQNFLPLSLVSNKNHINCRESSYWHNVKTDKYGFNNSNLIYEKKIDNIFLGDSYTFGNCVKNKNNIVKIFDKISKNNSLNLSMVGNGPLLNYASLREYYPEDKKIKNIVYIFYGGNDLRDIKNHMHNKLLIKYANDDNFSQNLKIKNSKKDLYLINKMQSDIKNYKEGLKYNPNVYKKFLTLFDLRIKFSSFYNKKNTKNYYDGKIYNYFDKNLKNLKKFALEKNIKLLIVYMPSLTYLTKKNSYGEVEADGDRIVNLIKKNDIYLLDMRKYLKNYDLEEIYPPMNTPYTRGIPIHLNEFGYSVTAQKIKKYLIQ